MLSEIDQRANAKRRARLMREMEEQERRIEQIEEVFIYINLSFLYYIIFSNIS